METCYTEEQRRGFDRYCQALMHLADLEFSDGFTGAIARRTKCDGCSGLVPSGIPAQYARSQRACCPACVEARGMTEAINLELNAGAPDFTEGERRSLLESALPPVVKQHAPVASRPTPQSTIAPRTKVTGIHATIARLEAQYAASSDPVERTGLMKLLEQARKVAA